MDDAAFRTFLLVRLRWRPATVDVAVKRLRFARSLGLSLPVTQEGGDDFLARRLGAGASPHALNNDVLLLNALARFPGGAGSWEKFKRPRAEFRYLRPEELRRVLAYTHPVPSVSRFRRALVSVALQSALRMSEVAALNVSDLDVERGELLVRQPAKGGKRRVLPLEAWCFSPKRPLRAYLRFRPVPPGDPDALWVTVGPRGPGRASPDYLRRTLWVLGREVGVSGLSFTRTRHTRATQLVALGWSPLYVKEFLGHASLTSTQVYMGVLPGALGREMRRRPGRDLYRGDEDGK